MLTASKMEFAKLTAEMTAALDPMDATYLFLRIPMETDSEAICFEEVAPTSMIAPAMCEVLWHTLCSLFNKGHGVELLDALEVIGKDFTDEHARLVELINGAPSEEPVPIKYTTFIEAIEKRYAMMHASGKLLSELYLNTDLSFDIKVVRDAFPSWSHLPDKQLLMRLYACACNAGYSDPIFTDGKVSEKAILAITKGWALECEFVHAKAVLSLLVPAG